MSGSGPITGRVEMSLCGIEAEEKAIVVMGHQNNVTALSAVFKQMHFFIFIPMSNIFY